LIYFIKRPSPYRAVNTPRLSYKNQSVNTLQGKTRCSPEIHTKHIKYTVWAEFSVFNAKLGGTFSNR
jgi:hypothetical protein